ncbi:hypothetical protein BHM03_00026027 [Ensete ventricosum]|uniref:Uncharacterized protein n=1 Tax=Ensete ventricosum TaxID=4639 RepID=A0A445MHB8_ENSVE|nr:hypothetical protein BHM03_00026027 [Ensete ventricosum]
MAMEQEQAHKSHRSHKSGASSKKKKNQGSLEQDAKERNPKVLESGSHFLSFCFLDCFKGSGLKLWLSLIHSITPGKQRRVQFLECPNDINGMIDAAKIADLALLLVDGSYGFEMQVILILYVQLWQVHIAGVGDFASTGITSLADPCPLPSAAKKKGLRDKEKLFYAPMSGLGDLLYDKDAVYININDHLVQFSKVDEDTSASGKGRCVHPHSVIGIMYGIEILLLGPRLTHHI